MRAGRDLLTRPHTKIADRIDRATFEQCPFGHSQRAMVECIEMLDGVVRLISKVDAASAGRLGGVPKRHRARPPPGAVQMDVKVHNRRNSSLLRRRMSTIRPQFRMLWRSPASEPRDRTEPPAHSLVRALVSGQCWITGHLPLTAFSCTRLDRPSRATFGASECVEIAVVAFAPAAAGRLGRLTATATSNPCTQQ
jgi:hypothetical protein